MNLFLAAALASIVLGVMPVASASSPAPSVASLVCCGALSAAGLGDRLSHPGSQAYKERVESYQARSQPWCLVRPISTKEVSTTVKTLVKMKKAYGCQFNIRSGGHPGWDGAAAVEGRVTIDLDSMNATTYVPETLTASIRPGSDWRAVSETLGNVGMNVADSRVGIGGLAQGGGYSFLSLRKGLVSDNIVNFEVVLASGEIVNVNKNTNPDVWKVLKRGANNIGVVTRVDLAALRTCEEREPIR